MKKLLIIVSSCILGLVIILFGAGLYINANIEEITRKHLGAKINFDDVEFRYFPMPTVVFTSLEIDHKNNKIKIPSLELYPNLMDLVRGRISLKKAVLEEPLVLAQLIPALEKEMEASDSPPLTLDAIPAERLGGLAINQGKLLLKGPGGLPQTISFTVAMENIEKKDQAISVQLKQFSVDELGLKFSGDITISSFSPLKLKVDAPEASINPAAVKDFLVKFGFIKKELGNQIPKIETVASKGLKLEIDPDAGIFRLSSAELSFDKNQIKDTTVSLAKGGAFDLKCAQILLDMKTIQGWLMDNPKGKEALDNILAKAKLNSLTTDGKVQLSSLNITGNQQKPTDINGSLDLKTDGLKIHLVSQDGQKQDLTINQLDTKVTITSGKPSVKIGKLQLSSSRGGTGTITGSFALPFHIKDIGFKGSLDSFRVFDTVVTLEAAKEKMRRLTFDLDLASPTLGVLAKGLVYTPNNKKTDLMARIEYLKIATTPSQQGPTPAGGTEKAPKDFDFTPIKGKKLFAEAFIRNFQLNALPELENINFTLHREYDKVVARGKILFCDTYISVNAILIPPSTVTAEIEGRGVGMDLTSFIACFSKELPVFLTGNISIFAKVFVTGDNPKTLLDTARGDITVTLASVSVYRLSNLDSRLGFLLDILNTAGINPGSEDSVSFTKGNARASMEKGRFVLDRFFLRGPLVDAWGSGEFLLKEKRLKLTGQVQTAGITKDLVVDRVLKRSRI
jgi:hypothetical protein